MGGLNTFSEARPYLTQQILFVAWLSEFLPNFNSRVIVKGSGPLKVSLHVLWGTVLLLTCLSCTSALLAETLYKFPLLSRGPTGDCLIPGVSQGRLETIPYGHILAAFMSPTSLFSAHFQLSALKPPESFATFHHKGPCWLTGLQKAYKGFHSAQWLNA